MLLQPENPMIFSLKDPIYPFLFIPFVPKKESALLIADWDMEWNIFHVWQGRGITQLVILLLHKQVNNRSMLQREG